MSFVFYQGKSLKTRAQAQYLKKLAEQKKRKSSQGYGHSMAEEVYQAQQMLGPGRQHYLRQNFYTQKTAMPAMILYAEEAIEFIRNDSLI